MTKVEFQTEYVYEPSEEQPYIATIEVALPVENETKHLITVFRSHYDRICDSELDKYWGYYQRESDMRTAKTKVYASSWYEAQIMADHERARIRAILERVHTKNIESMCCMPSMTKHEYRIGE